MELFYTLPIQRLFKKVNDLNCFRIQLICADNEFNIIVPKEKLKLENEINKIVIGGTQFKESSDISLQLALDDFDSVSQLSNLLTYLKEPTTLAHPQFDITIFKLLVNSGEKKICYLHRAYLYDISYSDIASPVFYSLSFKPDYFEILDVDDNYINHNMTINGQQGYA